MNGKVPEARKLRRRKKGEMSLESIQPREPRVGLRIAKSKHETRTKTGPFVAGIKKRFRMGSQDTRGTVEREQSQVKCIGGLA